MSTNVSYTHPFLLTTTWTYTFRDACCCEATLHSWQQSPEAFLANYSADALAANGGEWVNTTGYGQGYEATPTNFTGDPLLPGRLSRCNCSLTQFGLRDYETPSYNYTALNFQCANTTFVEAYLAPPVNLTYHTLMKASLIDLNFTAPTIGQLWNWMDRSAKKGVAPSLGTALFGFHHKLKVDLLNHAPDIAPFYTPAKLRTGIQAYSLPGQAAGTQCLFQTAMMLGPKYSSGFSVSIWMMVDRRRVGGSMPLMYLTTDGCFYKRHFLFALDADYVPFIREWSGSVCSMGIALPITQWLHVSWTMELNGRVRWYLNGHLVSTACAPMRPLDSDGFTKGWLGVGDPNDQWGVDYAVLERFYGEIAEFTMWNRTLTPEHHEMLHRWVEPAALQQRWPLRFTGLPTHKMLLPSGHSNQWVNFTLPWSYMPAFPIVDRFNISFFNRTVWFNTTELNNVTSTWNVSAGFDANGTQLWTTGSSWSLVPNTTLHSKVVVDNTTVRLLDPEYRDNPAYWNLTFLEFPLVIGVNVTDERVLLSSERQWVFDLASNWQRTLWSNGVLLSMPANLSSFNITFYTISGNDTFLDLPYTITFHNADWESIEADRLFEHKFHYAYFPALPADGTATPSMPTWNPKNDGGLMMVDGFQAGSYDIAALTAATTANLGGQHLPQTWNGFDAGWTFHAWLNHTYLAAETDLLTLSFEGSHPFGSRFVVQGGYTRVTLSPTEICVHDSAWYGGYPTTNTGQSYGSYPGVHYCTGKLAASIPIHQWWMLTLSLSRDGILRIYQNAILLGSMDTDHHAFLLAAPYAGNTGLTFGGLLRGGCGASVYSSCSSGRANIISMGHYSIYEWEMITPEVEVVFENPPPHLWRNKVNQFWVAETVPLSLVGGANWTGTFWPGGLFMPNLTDVGTAWINMSIRCRPAQCLSRVHAPLYPNDMLNMSWAVDPARGAQPQGIKFTMPYGASELVIEFELFGDVAHHAAPDTIVIQAMTLDLLVNRSNSNLTTLLPPFTTPFPGWGAIGPPFTDLPNAAHGFTDITNPLINPDYTNGMLSFISNWDKKISMFQPADGLQSPPNSHGLTLAMDHTMNTWQTGFTIVMWIYQFIPQGGPIFQSGRGDNYIDNVRFDIGTGFSFAANHYTTGLSGGSLSGWRVRTHQWFLVAFSTDKQYNAWLHQYQSNVMVSQGFNIGSPLNIIPRWSNSLGHLTLMDGTAYSSPHLAGLNGMIAQVLYYNNSLSATEIELLASHPPPALSAGRHQLFMLRPLPRMLPQSYNFTSLIRLPHLIGDAITLHIESEPPGLVFPTELSWLPKSKLPSQNGDKLLTISMINSTEIASIDIRFWVTGDIEHYSPPDNGTIWTYMLEPHLVLDYSYEMLISEAVFNLNCSWNVSAELGGHAAKDPLMPDVIWFNGLNHWLDLSVTADTGLTYPVNPRIYDYDVTSGYPHLYTKGWSVTTWVQFHEFSRDNPLVGCGATAPGPMSDGFSLKVLNTFPTSPPSASNFQIQFIMGNSYEYSGSSPSCTMTVAPTPNMFIYSWNFYTLTMDSYAIARVYQNGVLLGSVQCQFPLPKTRDRCWAGRSFTNDYFMTGRMAQLQFYPRALADGEISALARTLIRPMWQTPFQFPPWTPPPFLLNGRTQEMEMYPPHSVGGVRICATTVPANMVQPSNLTWTTANGIKPQIWKLTMPLNIPLLNISFAVCENLHPFPLWSVPPVSIVQNLTFTRLYAEAPQKITMNTPSEHGVWQANLRLLPNLGTLITSIVPAGGSYLDINDPNDVAPNSIVPVDPWHIPVNKGMSISAWLLINSESGTIFEFDRMRLRILNEQQLELYIYDYSSSRDGYCYMYAVGNGYNNYFGGSGATAMDTFVIDEWFHLLIHWDHWTGYVRLWTNGYLKLESRCSRGSSTVPWTPTWFAGSGMNGLNSFDGQVGNFYMWPRALWPWEVQLLAEATPKNIIPVKFRVKLVNNTVLPLALGWDTNAYMQYQMYLSFGTHPTLIPSWQCAQFPQYPCQTGGLQVLEPGRGLRYDMVEYFKTRWLIFRMNPGVFGNQKYSGHVPEITLNFDIVNDTLNYITPPPVTFGIPKLMNNTMFKLVTDLPSRNANWSYGGPTNWTNLGVAVLDAPDGGRFQSDPANKFLDLYNRFDTMSKLKAPKNVMNPIIDFTSGHTISVWLTLNQVPQNRTQTLFWCGVNGPTKPNENAIVFEFLPPNRRLQVQITNTFHWAYLQPPILPQYPLGFPYKVYTNCACGGTNSTIPVDRWFQIIVQIDWNNTISIFQNGFPLATCFCDIMPQFFRDTCVLGKNPNSFRSTFGKKDYIAAPNYYAPLNGSIAAFDWWPRILMKQEFDAITQSPPHTLWAFPMEFRENMTFQLQTLQQNGTFTVTPGLSVWSGLYITPLLETPTWYNPGPLILKIANLSSNDYDTRVLKFHPLSLQNTITFEVSWPANIPYAMVPLNLSNMAHYQYPVNYTIWNPWPSRLLNQSTFAINTTRDSASLDWRSSYSFVPNVGVAVVNNTVAPPSLDLMDIADTNVDATINNSPQGTWATTMPLLLKSSGFSLSGWFMFANQSDVGTPPGPTSVDFFSWVNSPSAVGNEIKLSVAYPSGLITFAFYTALSTAATPACSCTSLNGVPFTNWLPITVTLDPAGTMTVGVGVLGAQFSTATCSCPAANLYPDVAVSRNVARLGGVGYSGIEICSFNYWERPLTRLEQQVLYFAPPAAVSPSNWILVTEIPDHLFLNEPFNITWRLNSWTTISGPVTLNFQPSAGYTAPASLTFTSLQEMTFTFVAPSYPAMVRLSSPMSGDLLYHLPAPDIYIQCFGGRFTVKNVPLNMIPTIPNVISIAPNVLPWSSVQLRWFTTEGVTLGLTNYTWNSSMTLDPIFVELVAPISNSSWFLLSWEVVGGVGDAVYYIAPPVYNITLSYVSSVDQLSASPVYLFSYQRSDAIWFAPASAPPKGINLTVTTSLGPSILSQTSLWFRPFYIDALPLYITAPYTNVTSEIIVSFNVTGEDVLTFLSFPREMIIQWRPQRVIRLVEVPAVIFASQMFQIGLLMDDFPVVPLWLGIDGVFTGAQHADPYGYTRLNFTAWGTSDFELTYRISWDYTHYFTGQAPGGSSLGPFITLNMSIMLESTDYAHYIWDPETVPNNGLLIIPTGGLVFIQLSLPSTTMVMNSTMTLTFTAMSQPYDNRTVGNMTIIPSAGRIFPPMISFDFWNWDQPRNVTFFAPDSFDQAVTFSYVMSGTNEAQFVPPREDQVEVSVLGLFKMTSPARTLWLGQPSVFQVDPVGYLPGCYMTYWCTPVHDSLFFPADAITFTPLVLGSSFILFAPTYTKDLNITISFQLIGGPDFDKMVPPTPFIVKLNRTDLWDVQVFGASWTGPALPSFEELIPLNFTGRDPLTGYWYNRAGFGYWFEQNATIIHGIGRLTINATFDTPGSVTAWVQTQFWNETLGAMQSVTTDPVLVPFQTVASVYWSIGGVGRSTLFISSSADEMTYRYQMDRLPTDVSRVKLSTTPGVFYGGFVGADLREYVADWDPRRAERQVLPYSIPYNITHLSVSMNFSEEALLDPWRSKDAETGYIAEPNDCSISWINEWNQDTALVLDEGSTDNFYRFSNVRWFNNSNGTLVRNASYVDHSPVIALSLGTNLIYVNCSLDGVYIYNLTRAQPDVYGLELNADGTPFQPAFGLSIIGAYKYLPFVSYNATVRYGHTMLNFAPMYYINNTIAIGYRYQPASQLIFVSTSHPAALIYVARPTSEISIRVWQEHKFIYYYFNVTRLPSNVQNVTLTGSVMGLGHELIPLSYSPSFPNDVDYVSVVNYKVTELSFQVFWTVPQQIALNSVDLRNQNPGAGYFDEIVSSGDATRFYPLVVGDNWFHVNSSVDGVYHFLIKRNAPEIRSWFDLQLRFVSQNATTVRNAEVGKTMVPQFQPGLLENEYSLTLPFIWKSVGLWFNSSFPASVFTMSYLNDTNATTFISATNLVDSAGTLPLVVPGTTNLIVKSPNDGWYVFHVTVLPPDVQRVVFYSSNRWAYPGNAGPSSLIVNRPWESAVYSYSSLQPYITTALSVEVEFRTNDTVWIDMLGSGGAIQRLENNSASIFVNLPDGLSTFRVQSSLDGQYSFLINRVPDMSAFALQATLDRKNFIYAPLATSLQALPLPTAYVARATGETKGFPAFPFVPSVHNHTMILPFMYSSLNVLALSKTNISFALDYASAQDPEAPGTPDPLMFDWTLLPPSNYSSLWPLDLGFNMLHLNVSADGYYLFNVHRLQGDLLNMTLTAVPATPGWTPMPLTDLTPLFQRNDLGDYLLTVPMSVGSFRPLLTFLTASPQIDIVPDSGASYLQTSGVLGAAIPLIAAQVNNITVRSPQDGVYSLFITRLPPDSTQFFVTAYDEELVPTPIPIVGPIPGVYSYTIQIPYGTTFLSLNTTSSSDHPEYISVTGGGLPFAVVNGGANPVQINNTNDGSYTIIVQWLPPDITDVQLRMKLDGAALTWTATALPSKIYTGTPGSLTAGQTGLLFNPAVRSWIWTIPFKYNSVLLKAVATNATTFFEVAYPTPPDLTWWQYAPTFAPSEWMLSTGLNQLRMNSTKDGRYRFDIVRLEADILNVTALPLPATPGFAALVPPITLDPLFVHNTFGPFSAVVPMSTGSLRWQVWFNSPGSIQIFGPFNQAVPVNAVPTSAFLLQANSDNFFTFVSSEDGNYTVNVHRNGSDTRNVVVDAFDAQGVVTSVSLQPIFADGVYNYTAIVPFGSQTSCLSADSLSGVITGTGCIALNPLTPGSNVFHFQNSLDGEFTVSIIFAAPDIRAIVMQHPGGQTAVLDPSLSTGLAQTPFTLPAATNASYAAKSWNAYVLAYSFVVPFAFDSVNLHINFSTASSLSISNVDYFNVRQVTKPTGPGVIVLPQLHLKVGSNRFEVNSTQDGYYLIDIERGLPDVRAMEFKPVNGTVMPAGAPALPTALTLSPTFLQGTFVYQVLAAVPVYVDKVSVLATFMTAGTFALPNGTAWSQLVSGVYSDPTLMPLKLGVNEFNITSAQDGVFHIRITRAQPDVVTVVLQQYDVAGNPISPSVIPAMVPPFGGGVFVYDLLVPFGAASTSSNGTTLSGLPMIHAGGSSWGTSQPLAAQPGVPMTYVIQSPDGDYVFRIVRMSQDVTDLAYHGRNNRNGNPFWQDLFGFNYTRPQFRGTEQTSFETVVPFDISHARFNLSWMTALPPLSTVVQVYLKNNATGNVTAYQFDAPFTNWTRSIALEVGPNLVTLKTARDGNYTFDIFRNVSGLDPCVHLRPCLYGSLCSTNYSEVYQLPYTCVCAPGFTGPRCETPAGDLPPPLLTKPVGVLSAPSSLLGNCDTLNLDARVSYGRLTAPFGQSPNPLSVSFEFFIQSIFEVGTTRDLLMEGLLPVTAGNISALTITRPHWPMDDFISIPAYELYSNVTYEFGLRVHNQYAVSNPVFVRVTKEVNDSCIAWMPAVSIIPPSLVQRPNRNVFRMHFTPGPAPLPADAVMAFTWSVKVRAADGAMRDTNEMTEYTSLSMLPLHARDLPIPPFWLVVDEIYYLRLSVAITSASGGSLTYSRRLLGFTSLTGYSDAQVVVHVVPSNLYAFIVGGDRERRNDLAMQLDGSFSTDPDNSNLAPNVPIRLQWSCVIKSDVSYLVPQPPACAIPAGQVASPVVTVLPNTLVVGLSYEFRLNVFSTLAYDNRTATTAVKVLMLPVPLIATPVVLIVNAPRQVNLQDILRLTAFVVTTSPTPLNELLYAWTVTPYLDLQSSAVLGGLPNLATLVVRGGMLTPGFVTFTITVTDPLNNATASASALISVSFPPTGGVCTMTPRVGFASLTLFYVQCNGWIDPNGAEPFLYQMKVRDLDNPAYGLTTLTPMSYAPFANLLLPAGQLEVQIFISNTLGAQAIFPITANVTLSQSAIDDPTGFIRNVTQGVIGPALANCDVTGAIATITQLANMLNTLDPDVNAAAIVQTRSDLLAALVVASNATTCPDSAELCRNIAATLSSITGGLLSDTDIQTAQDLMIIAIDCLASEDDPAVAGAALAGALSNLMTNCSQLDASTALMQRLIQAALEGTVAGESIPTWNTTNLVATLVRSDLSSGSTVTQDGVVLTLPPGHVYNESQTLNNLNAGNLDLANAPSPPTLDSRIIQYNNLWARCRLANSTLVLDACTRIRGAGSSSQDIQLTLSDGSPLDFSHLEGPVAFLLPISYNASTYTPVAEDFSCSWWNPQTQQYSGAGCVNEGLVPTPSGVSLNCSCSHLTEFSALRTTNICAADAFGKWWYLIFGALYSLTALFAMFQFQRVFRPFKCTYWLMTTEHMLVGTFCVFRAINMLIMWELHKSMALATMAIVLSLPYLFLSWIFTFVIFAWASIYHSSKDGAERSVNPFARYRSLFITLNSGISAALFTLFVAISQTSDPDQISRLADAGSFGIAVMSISFCVFFAMYGTLLVRAITKDFVSPYSRKLSAVAMSLSACFFLAAGILIWQQFSGSQNDDKFNISYYTFDWIGIVIVLLLFSKSVKDVLSPATRTTKSKTFTTRGSLFGSQISQANVVIQSEFIQPAEPSASSELSDSDSDSESQPSGIVGPLMLAEQYRVEDEDESGDLSSAADAAARLAATRAAMGLDGNPNTVEDEGAGAGSSGLPRRNATMTTAEKLRAMRQKRGSAASAFSFALPTSEAPGSPSVNGFNGGPLLSPSNINLGDMSDGDMPGSITAAIPLMDAKQLGRNPHAWILYEGENDPLPAGMEVKRVEQFDENGNSFEPKQFKDYVLKADLKALNAIPKNDLAALGKNAHRWIMHDEINDGAIPEGLEVKKIEQFDDEGKSFSPPQFHTYVVGADVAALAAIPSSDVAALGKNAHKWMLFDQSPAELPAGMELKKIEQLDELGQPFSPPVFHNYVQRDDLKTVAALPPADLIALGPTAHRWIMMDDEAEKELPKGFAVKKIEQFDENGVAFTPAMFKTYVQKDDLVKAGIEVELPSQSAPVVPITAAGIAAAKARAMHAWQVLDFGGEEAASSVPAPVFKRSTSTAAGRTAMARIAAKMTSVTSLTTPVKTPPADKSSGNQVVTMHLGRQSSTRLLGARSSGTYGATTTNTTPPQGSPPMSPQSPSGAAIAGITRLHIGNDSPVMSPLASPSLIRQGSRHSRRMSGVITASPVPPSPLLAAEEGPWVVPTGSAAGMQERQKQTAQAEQEKQAVSAAQSTIAKALAAEAAAMAASAAPPSLASLGAGFHLDMAATPQSDVTNVDAVALAALHASSQVKPSRRSPLTRAIRQGDIADDDEFEHQPTMKRAASLQASSGPGARRAVRMSSPLTNLLSNSGGKRSSGGSTVGSGTVQSSSPSLAASAASSSPSMTSITVHRAPQGLGAYRLEGGSNSEGGSDSDEEDALPRRHARKVSLTRGHSLGPQGKANSSSVADVARLASTNAKPDKPLSRMQVLALEAIAKAQAKASRPKVQLGFGSAVVKPSAAHLTHK